MADNNGKEHNVMIANCSRECHALPLDVGLWEVLRVHHHGVFRSLYSISKADLVLLAIFAIFICQTAYVALLLWNTYDPLMINALAAE